MTAILIGETWLILRGNEACQGDRLVKLQIWQGIMFMNTNSSINIKYFNLGTLDSVSKLLKEGECQIFSKIRCISCFIS